MSTAPVDGQHDKASTKEETQSIFIQDAPPLLPTLTSSKYHIKWKQLAEIPAPLRRTHVAVQGGKVYVTGGISPVNDAQLQVFVYEIDNDRWGQLPTPDHYLTIPHIIGGKLTLIGGRLIATKKITNKVSTFDQAKQSWVSHYPNLLSARNKPGVLTHMEYVIVAGGAKGDDVPVVLDDIEILDWIEKAHWRKASIHLPVPMCALQLAIYDDTVFVTGYADTLLYYDKHVYKIPVAVITSLADQQCASTRWIRLGETTHRHSSVVTGLSSLIVVGGCDATGTTKDMKMYESSTQKWKKIDSLSFARYNATATAINYNAVIILGGCTSVHDPDTTNLTVVELGQVEQV